MIHIDDLLQKLVMFIFLMIFIYNMCSYNYASDIKSIVEYQYPIVQGLEKSNALEKDQLIRVLMSLYEQCKIDNEIMSDYILTFPEFQNDNGKDKDGVTHD